MVRRSRNLSDAVDLAVIDKDAAIFAISVAAELAGMHPQTLRTYDRLGLVVPERTRGRGRATRCVTLLRCGWSSICPRKRGLTSTASEGSFRWNVGSNSCRSRWTSSPTPCVGCKWRVTRAVKIRESLLLSRPAGCIWVGRSFMPSWHCLLIVVDFRPRWCGLL